MKIIERIKAQEPVFFAKMKKYALTIGVFAGCMYAAKAKLGLEYPDWLSQVLTYVIGVSAGLWGASKLTAKIEEKGNDLL